MGDGLIYHPSPFSTASGGNMLFSLFCLAIACADGASSQTTASLPDGSTVILGALTRMNEDGDEFGRPAPLCQIGYINRLFKNPGYGKETSSLLLMFPLRVIINSAEEFLHTAVDSTGLLTNR